MSGTGVHRDDQAKTATVYSIAAELGVSPSTVSRAFSRPELVKKSVRERVLAVAAERSYAPNRTARGLATGRTGLIGLLVLDITNPFFPPLVRAVEHAATAADAAVLLADAEPGGPDEARLVRRLASQVDGLILASTRMTSAELTKAIGATPTVLVNRVANVLPSVVCDNSMALEQAADHLVELGHRRIALLRGPAKSWAARSRAAAVRSWAKSSPADVTLVELGPSEATFESGHDAVAAIVSSEATGIIAFDDFMACGVMAGLAERGLSVPGSHSVVGCDDVLLARTLTPQLTTVTAPFDELGRRAVTMLSELIAGDRPANEVIPGHLTVRGTTGPVART